MDEWIEYSGGLECKNGPERNGKYVHISHLVCAAHTLSMCIFSILFGDLIHKIIKSYVALEPYIRKRHLYRIALSLSGMYYMGYSKYVYVRCVLC